MARRRKAKRKGSKALRTRKGSVTAKARRRHGTLGKRFPIFDSRSARSALKLRGHGTSKAGRAKIVRKAARYAPAAAAKARKADSKR